MAECLERDTWTSGRWKNWTEDRTAELLHRAATRVPYYREQWGQRRRRGDSSSWERLENWPAIDRVAIRRNPHAFLADDCDPRRMTAEVTSGTMGSPTQLWYSSQTLTAWYALFEARCRRWNGLSRGDAWGLLAGQAVADPLARRPPYWVWNRGLRQLYLSCYHATPDNAGHYMEALRQHDVQYLMAYPSSLYSIAQGILRHGFKPPRLKVILTQSEQLFDFQRRAFEEAFECPVRDSYGMSEICAAAAECGHGTMHLWPDAGVVEEVDGELVSTGLINGGMPLIRYRTGDRGKVAESGGACACGRSLPTLTAIEGRISDTIHAPDGRKLSPNLIEGIFDAQLPVEEAQIVQYSRDAITVRVVPTAAFNARTSRAIESEIVRRVGRVAVTIEHVERIPRGPNGKMRAVVSQLPAGSS